MDAMETMHVEPGKYHSSHSTPFEIASVSASHCITLPMDELGSLDFLIKHTYCTPKQMWNLRKSHPSFTPKLNCLFPIFHVWVPPVCFWMVYHVNISQHPLDTLPKYLPSDQRDTNIVTNPEKSRKIANLTLNNSSKRNMCVCVCLKFF